MPCTSMGSFCQRTKGLGLQEKTEGSVESLLPRGKKNPLIYIDYNPKVF